MNIKPAGVRSWLLPIGFLLLPCLPARAQCPDLENLKLVPGGSSEDEYGRTVAVHGDLALVGAHGSDLAATDAGAVYAYRFDGVTWSLEQVLTASDATPGDSFGFSVSLREDLAVVGARHDDAGGLFRAGSAYLFERQGDRWVERQKLLPGDPEPGDQFGFSVSYRESLIAIGSPFDDEVCPGVSDCDSGSAYIFRLDSGSGLWIEEQKLTADDAGSGNWFGVSVSGDGDRVLIGSVFDDDAGADSGSAYVFRFEGTWVQEQKLLASDAGPGKKFAKGVSLSGDVGVVGSFAGQEPGAGPGAAYVFRRAGTTWSEEQRLTPGDGRSGDNFGLAVSIDGPVVVVGAFTDDEEAGSAYVYRRTDRWVEERKLVASDRAPGDQFGWAVSVSGDHVLVGAFLDEVAGTDTGSASVYPDAARPGCAAGTVATATGPPQEVLLVNGSPGNLHRVVRTSVGQPLSVTLDSSPAGPGQGRYALFVWASVPTGCFPLTAGGETLGCFVLPTSLHAASPLPVLCLRSPDLPPRACIGVPERPSPARTPFQRQRASALAAATFTLQAVLEDAGAANASGFSVSNSVVLRIVE